MDYIREVLKKGFNYDVNFNFGLSTSDGWKLSLQGKSIEDSYNLYELLREYLSENMISFKVATSKRFGHSDMEQSKKAMTIYIPNNLNIYDVCEDVYTLTKNYKGWHDIKTPTSYEHYSGCVFYRNDRDNNGNYIKAK